MLNLTAVFGEVFKYLRESLSLTLVIKSAK